MKNTRRADLHIHSNFSDGDFDITKIIEKIIANNINVFSITDHDNIESSRYDYQLPEGIKYITGVEMSVKYKNFGFHLLAYDYNNNTGALEKLCHEISIKRKERLKTLIDNVKKNCRFKFNKKEINEILELSRTVGSTYIMRIIKREYKDYNEKQINEKFIKNNDTKDKIDISVEMKECISAMRECNSVIILAHPKEYEEKYKIDIADIIEELILLGIDGIEVYNCRHTKEDIKRYKNLAEKYGLLKSGGSDYHGEFIKADVSLGSGSVDNDSIYETNISILDYIKNKHKNSNISKLSFLAKTNRYCDKCIDQSFFIPDNAKIKDYLKEKYAGHANIFIYLFYKNKILKEEKKLKNFIKLDIYKYESFIKYIKMLESKCEDIYGYFLKDDAVYALLNKNKPVGTIDACYCKNLKELLKKYNCREIMALTRLFEDKKWKTNTFEIIKNTIISDYENRKVDYFIFNSSEFKSINGFNKITWDDKICGSTFSIFNENYISKVPYLRTVSEFFHFFNEYEFYNEFMRFVIKENKIEKFYEYLKNEMYPWDIYDPHALSEGLAWNDATKKLFSTFQIFDKCWNQKKLKIYSNKKYILSNNIIDYIRAVSSAKFPNICTVTSLIVRLDILNSTYTYNSCCKAIVNSLDKGIINYNELIKKE